MKWVAGASVAAKWLAPEPDSPLAEALLDDELIVPGLLFAEVDNILWNKQRRGEMDAARDRDVVERLLKVDQPALARAVGPVLQGGKGEGSGSSMVCLRAVAQCSGKG